MAFKCARKTGEMQSPLSVCVCIRIYVYVYKMKKGNPNSQISHLMNVVKTRISYYCAKAEN